MIDLTRTMESSLTEKEPLLREIIDNFLGDRDDAFKSRVLGECLRREEEASTMVTGGIAFPHAVLREEIKPGVYCCFAGAGIPWNSAGDRVGIVILLVCREEDHLSTLSELASILHQPGVSDRLLGASGEGEMRAILLEAQTGREERRLPARDSASREILATLKRLYTTIPNIRIILFSDSPAQIGGLAEQLPDCSLILVSSRVQVLREKKLLESGYGRIVPVPSIRDRRSILKELWTERILKEGELVLCLWGFEFEVLPHSFSILSIPGDLYEEARVRNYRIPHRVNLEILSRVVSLASELSRQGREGKPAGTIFVVGEYDKIKDYCRQLIINPFGGLEDHERSILDPSLSETIKEFSKIDGAYIIDNTGKILSGGTYLSIPPHNKGLQPGLGARHAAALGITLAAPVASVVISESTGEIRVFWDGAEQDLFIPR